MIEQDFLCEFITEKIIILLFINFILYKLIKTVK